MEKLIIYTFWLGVIAWILTWLVLLFNVTNQDKRFKVISNFIIASLCLLAVIGIGWYFEIDFKEVVLNAFPIIKNIIT